MKKFIVALIAFYSSVMCSCPFEIINDIDTPVMIINPYKPKYILYLEPKAKGFIDPEITNFIAKYVTFERLDFYVPSTGGQEAQKNQFYKKYQLIEKYCSKNKTQLSIKQVQELAKAQTDRFEVKQFFYGA